MPNFAQNQSEIRQNVPGVNSAFVRSEYPRHRCVHELLQEQGLRSAQAIAAQFKGQSVTYAELHARANQLARLLQKQGVGPEVLVGLSVERSLEMVVALLAILKAGGAYVPLDPAYPADRIKYVLENSRAKVLLTQPHLLKSLPSVSAKTICLDSAWKCVTGESSDPVESGVTPDNLAYVIYTSGSTGKPKGVQVEHRSVVNFLCSMRREPGLDAKDVLVAVTTLSFDIAGLEMYLPLLVGARLVVADSATTYDGRQLAALVLQSGATVMQATPATWRLLFESGWTGNRNLKVLVGGEALSPELARKLTDRCGPVWNMYGPTETTIWSSIYRVTKSDERMVPIGLPIANTSFYILDEHRKPVPSGSEGELFIGGEGLARGYFERDDLTAERFVVDPFTDGRGKMYRTGDLARMRPDGNLEFLGRIDHQVKIRGFRIELGEIEAVLEQHASVQHAVVASREDTSGDQRLVAYVVPKTHDGVTSDELRSHLKQSLPDYMMPSAFVQLGTLPLTPNGKIDRKALPAPDFADLQADRNYVAPRNSIEVKLAHLWEEVLGIRPIGVTTSFFDLGGRSLLAARLFMRITQDFGRDLPISTLFRAPTVEQLAQELQPQKAPGNSSSLIAIQRSGSKPPFFCVHGGEGSTLFLHRFAREMGPEQPFYAFEAEGLDGREFRRTSVKDMAAHFMSQMTEVQPDGPYRIGGYCFGGLVAFEMAQQLQARGEKPEIVGLFSAPLRFNRLTATPQKKAAEHASGADRLKRLLLSPRKALGWRVAALGEKIRSRMHSATCSLFLTAGLKIPQSMRTLYIVRTLQRAEEQYIPQKYPGTIVLFCGGGLEENADDPRLGWDGLANEIEHYEIGEPGQRSRRDIMNEPLVSELARQLSARLEQSGGTSATAARKISFNRALETPASVARFAVREPAS
jgi:amino acid adenylation domain-containing protein